MRPRITKAPFRLLEHPDDRGRCARRRRVTIGPEVYEQERSADGQYRLTHTATGVSSGWMPREYLTIQWGVEHAAR